MRYEAELAVRYLFTRSKLRFISLVGVIAILGVATGVATLIVVIGVMSGFDSELRERIIGTSSHVVIEKLGGIDDPQQLQREIARLPRIAASAPFVHTQALLFDESKMHSVIVRGIDPLQERDVSELPRYIVSGTWDMPADGVLIGKDLAQRLLVRTGDTIQLLTLGRVSGREFRVSGIFSSGMYDFDANVVFIPLAAAQELSDTPELVSGISVRLRNVYAADAVKEQLQQQLGFPYICRTWMDLNRNLFNALKLEKTAMFVILTLIILVASLNIASTLIMMVMEKTKDIGILKAIGVDEHSIGRIFMLVGTGIGVVGTGVGVAGGLVLAFVLKTYRFIHLPKDVYYIDTLPVEVTGTDIAWIVGAAVLITLISTVYPARQAARMNPVEALRYE